jgi:hypothetical protein
MLTLYRPRYLMSQSAERDFVDPNLRKILSVALLLPVTFATLPLKHDDLVTAPMP